MKLLFFLRSPSMGPRLGEGGFSEPKGVSGINGLCIQVAGFWVQERAKTMTLVVGGGPILRCPPLPPVRTTAPSRVTVRPYLRVSSPAGHFSRPRRIVSCSRPRQPWFNLGTEVSYREGSGKERPTPQPPPWAGLGHSRELCQLQGLAQAGGQSGHVLWPEAALTQPEGGGQGAEPGRGLSGLLSCCLPVSPRTIGEPP